MKKSNKLLLGGFLTVILLITGIHIALYAKYKNGNYTIYHPEDKQGQSFPGVSFVTIRNIHGATVYFGDTVKVENGKEDMLQYVQEGDSLIITGRNSNDQPGGTHRVSFTLPNNVTLSAFNSFISFEHGKETSETNVVINLQNSHAIFRDPENSIRLGHIKLAASDSSIAAFHGNTQVDHLEVQLTNSALEYNEGNNGQLSIVTDSVSRVSLQSKHLLKAKITISPNKP